MVPLDLSTQNLLVMCECVERECLFARNIKANGKKIRKTNISTCRLLKNLLKTERNQIVWLDNQMIGQLEFFEEVSGRLVDQKR